MMSQVRCFSIQRVVGARSGSVLLKYFGAHVSEISVLLRTIECLVFGCFPYVTSPGHYYELLRAYHVPGTFYATC